MSTGTVAVNHTGRGCRDGGHGNIEEDLVQEEAKRPEYQEQGNITPAWQSDAFEKPDGKQEQGSRSVAQQTEGEGTDIPHRNASEDKSCRPEDNRAKS